MIVAVAGVVALLGLALGLAGLVAAAIYGGEAELDDVEAATGHPRSRDDREIVMPALIGVALLLLALVAAGAAGRLTAYAAALDRCGEACVIAFAEGE